MKTSIPNIDQLRDFAGAEPAPTISLYMPTHRTGRETRQDPIRLKNLLGKAEQQLAVLGCTDDEVDAILKPARQLPKDVVDPFWEHGADGLALLLRRSGATCYKLPIEFPELALASDSYFLNPLLEYYQNDGHFYVLAVSQNSVRLMSGTKHALGELELDSLPKSLVDALNIDEYQSALQYHSHMNPQQQSAAGGEAIYHGHGAGEGDDKKHEILQYFYRLVAPLQTFLSTKDAPLVFAGVEYLFPLFQQACEYRNLVKSPLAGNPDDRSAEELHAPAWALVKDQFERDRDRALERYGTAAANGLAATNLDESLDAAEQGRIETLFLVDSTAMPGNSSDETARVDELQRYCDVAAKTLSKGGIIYLVEPDQMPTPSNAAAILRY